MTEQFIVKIGVGRSKDDIQNSLTLYDFREFLGGERTTFDYECFCKCKELSSDPVDLWQIVPANFGSIKELVMLVDEEGLLHDPQNPINFVATISASIGYPIVGDVFLCTVQGEDLMFLTQEEVRRIYEDFVLDPPSPLLVH